MALYTRHCKKITNDSIIIDDDCYMGDKVIKVRAQVEGRSQPQLLWWEMSGMTCGVAFRRTAFI